MDCFLLKQITSGGPKHEGGDDFSTRSLFDFSFLIFPGILKRAFQPNLTQKEDFFLNDKTKVQVDMMRKTEQMLYSRSEELFATMVKMPFKGNVSLILMLPDAGHFDNALKKLTAKRAKLQKTSNFRYAILKEYFRFELDFCSALTSSMQKLYLGGKGGRVWRLVIS